MTTNKSVEEIVKEFEERFPKPMRKIERLRDLGICVEEKGLSEKILDEQEYNIEVTKWINYRKFLIKSLTSHTNTVLQGVVERIKRIEIPKDNSDYELAQLRFRKDVLSLLNDQIISNEK